MVRATGRRRTMATSRVEEEAAYLRGSEGGGKGFRVEAWGGGGGREGERSGFRV